MDRTAATSLGPVVTPLRCTVYARTSSHEAIDQAYTSLDAQLDAGLAYIASQAGAGKPRARPTAMRMFPVLCSSAQDSSA
jgi:hypothetical protein